VSRIEAGHLDLREEPVDLEEAIESCLRLVRLRAEEGGIALASTVPLGLPRLCADGTRVRQIFLNLLSNAVKFTPRGGSVALDCAMGDGGTLVVTVCDTGIGMSAEEMTIAFQPFRQVDSSLARRFEGTGLGLPLARRLVEVHGGVLRMTSTPGE